MADRRRRAGRLLPRDPRGLGTCPPRTDITAGVEKNNFQVQSGVLAFDGTREPFFQQHVARIDEPLPTQELLLALSKRVEHV